jgi:hypothetical protein
MDRLNNKIIESEKVNIKLRNKIEDWETLIASIIYKHFSQQPFCCYDVVKKILGNETNRRKFYMWAMRVRKVLRVLESNNKIKFVGWQPGKAPIQRKIFKVVV